MFDCLEFCSSSDISFLSFMVSFVFIVRYNIILLIYFVIMAYFSGVSFLEDVVVEL